MDEKIVNQIVDELFPSLEDLETRSAGIELRNLLCGNSLL